MNKSRTLVSLTALAGAALAAAALAVPSSAAEATTTTTTTTTSTTTTTYVKAEPLCSTPKAYHARCFALRSVRTTKDSPGARAASTVRPAYATGPSGGYTPGDLASAYGVNPDLATTQVVGIVDAYDDPAAKADLTRFDAAYGLPAETGTSFKKVSQTGSTTTFPQADEGWAGEISLDVDAVRGLCHKCRIVLVEANSNSDADLAAAENQAVAQGATIVSNSFGGAEGTSIPSSFAAAFRHPGVVILASTGDHGMYDWDVRNGGSDVSSDAPNAPSSLATVVAVGGTTLYLNDDGTRSGESVWNENGSSDVTGNNLFSSLGATGGGCSTLIDAPMWQQKVANWGQTTCGTKRLPADVSALADPFTGFDVYDSFGGGGWSTLGGTSLATPLVAAMWALAGGSGGVTWPALSLYGHVKSDTTPAFNDITTGGNGLCDGTPAYLCEQSFGIAPNTFGEGILDCAWLPESDELSAGTRSCDAATGYDGPSGVGTPHGLTGFTALKPTARITPPASVKHGAAATFSAAASTDPFPGGKVVTYVWNWGDGTTTSSTVASVSHTYAAAGSRTVTLTVTDNYNRTASTSTAITVS